MGIFAWIVMGLLAGVIAKLIMPGRQGGGLIVTTVLGIAGAFVGGFIARQMGWDDDPITFDLPSFGLAVLGSLALLLIFGLIRGKQQ